MSSLLDLGNIWLAHEVHLQVAAEHHHFKIKNSYTFFFFGSADSIKSGSEGLWLKMSSLLDLGNIWLAHEVHLQVAAEHHHGVHQARLEDGVVQREQQIVGLPTKIVKKITGKDKVSNILTSIHTLIKRHP
jgi:hypothetical protein